MSQLTTGQLEDRLTALERAGRFAVYSRFYAALAVLPVAVSFLPLFDDVVSNGLRTTYGTLWQMAARPGGGAAVSGILLLLGLVALLACAAIRPQSPGLAIAIAADSALIALMLIGKPGTGTPKPDLADGGRIGMAIVSFALVVGVVHAVHLIRDSVVRQAPAVISPG